MKGRYIRIPPGRPWIFLKLACAQTCVSCKPLTGVAELISFLTGRLLGTMIPQRGLQFQRPHSVHREKAACIIGGCQIVERVHALHRHACKVKYILVELMGSSNVQMDNSRGTNETGENQPLVTDERWLRFEN